MQDITPVLDLPHAYHVLPVHILAALAPVFALNARWATIVRLAPRRLLSAMSATIRLMVRADVRCALWDFSPMPPVAPPANNALPPRR